MSNLTENLCKLGNGNGFDFDNHSDLAKKIIPKENEGKRSKLIALIFW
tara:strand:+ start:381 stop:524 length:144 start_codon:yes stop_codon:yes gene_type:complete